MAALDVSIDLFTSRGEVGRRAGFVLLAGLLASFVFIRTSARLIRMKVSWWPGNLETRGGLHIHHMVWGILLLLVAGFLAFALDPGEPWVEVLALLFGIGAGLTLDEFALWLRLEDVYWKQQGRESIDAVVIAVLFAGLVLIGLSPLDVAGPSSTAAVVVTVVVVLALCSVTILKGKLATGVTGMFVAPVALVGAVRLAKPDSPWAHWRYRDDPGKRDRALARHGKRDDLRDRLRNLVGGAPSG